MAEDRIRSGRGICFDGKRLGHTDAEGRQRKGCGRPSAGRFRRKERLRFRRSGRESQTTPAPANAAVGPKVLGIVAGVLVGVAVVAVVGVNVFVRVAYAPFYQQAEAAFPIPGINSGFICQDLDRLEHGDAWLFSGYTTEGGPSPVYRRSADGSVQRLLLAAPDGELYHGHGSAITSSGRYVYVACEGGLLVFEESDLVNAADGDTVLALGKVDLDFTPSFGNVEGEYLLVGNFYRAGNYANARRAPHSNARRLPESRYHLCLSA